MFRATKISIHSLRMEGDRDRLTAARQFLYFNPLPPHGGRPRFYLHTNLHRKFQSTPSAWRETFFLAFMLSPLVSFQSTPSAWRETSAIICSRVQVARFQSTPSAWRETISPFWKHVQQSFQSTPSAWRETDIDSDEEEGKNISIHSLRMEGDFRRSAIFCLNCISIHSLRMEGDSKTAQESVFHFAYPCTILQKRMQKTTFCTRKNGFFRKKGEKFGAKPSASFCAPMIRTDTFPLNFSHRISGSSMSMVSFAPICSTFD